MTSNSPAFCGRLPFRSFAGEDMQHSVLACQDKHWDSIWQLSATDSLLRLGGFAHAMPLTAGGVLKLRRAGHAFHQWVEAASPRETCPGL